jgi:hypothetical protein
MIHYVNQHKNRRAKIYFGPLLAEKMRGEWRKQDEGLQKLNNHHSQKQLNFHVYEKYIIWSNMVGSQTWHHWFVGASHSEASATQSALTTAAIKPTGQHVT